MVWTIEFFESVQHKKRQGNMRNIVAPEYAQYLARGLQPGQRLGGIFFTGTSYQVDLILSFLFDIFFIGFASSHAAWLQ